MSTAELEEQINNMREAIYNLEHDILDNPLQEEKVSMMHAHLGVIEDLATSWEEEA